MSRSLKRVYDEAAACGQCYCAAREGGTRSTEDSPMAGTRPQEQRHRASVAQEPDQMQDIGRVTVHAVETAELVRAPEQVEQLAAERSVILGQIADGLMIADNDLRITYMNEAGRRLLGFDPSGETVDSAAETLNMRTFDGRPCRGDDLALIRAVRHRETTTNVEWRIYRADGAEVIIQGSAAPVLAADDTLYGAVFTFRDMTEQRRTEEALREREEQMRTIFHEAPMHIAIMDLDGRFLDANPAMQEMLGYSVDELRGIAYTEVTHREDAIAHAQLTQELVDGKRDRLQLEKRYIRKDGQMVWGNLSASLVRDANGEPEFVIGMVQYITDRKRMKDELRARARQQAAVAQLGQYALATTNVSGLLHEAVNVVAQTLEVEYSKVLELLPDGSALLLRDGVGWNEGLVGRTTVGAQTDSQAGYTLLSHGPVTAQDMHTETRFRQSGLQVEHAVVSGISVAIQGKDRPFGVLGVDTTQHRTFTHDDIYFLQAVAHVLAAAIERKRAEEERARHSQELTMRVLQAQEEERKRIARELHDETVQALSTLLVNLDLLEPQALGSKAHTPEFERVRFIARRALDGARAIAQTLRPPILDDLGLVAALEALGAEYMHIYGTPVEITAEPVVLGERLIPEVEMTLFRIAQEALTNACKHANAGWVHVRLSISHGAVELIVEDNGKGFDFDHVAQPTWQGGFGLYGMRERSTLLDGKLTIDTGPGRGTRVTLVVPLYGKSRVMGDDEHNVGEDTRIGSDVRVLLVDDHAMFREGLRLVLDAQSGFAVIGEAEDGRQALKLVERLQPDVVVMDVAMPRLNGADATLQIKRRFPDVKVVILTTHENREYLVQIAKVGADGYVLKRSAGAELGQALKAVAQGQSYISPTIAGMMLDDYRVRIDQSGENLLTPREREVLQLAAEGLANQAIARQLVISIKTVQRHRDSIMRKLGAHDRTDLVKYAIRTGMITPG
jgi:PAS domain S-box-containing protein